METFEAIKTRRSVRSYSSKPIPEDVLNKILEAGMWAPSGMGRQSAIMVVATGETRDRISAMNAAVLGRDTDPFYGAPVAVCVLCDKSIPTHTYDGPLVAQNLMLEAHDLGVSSCYIFRGKQMWESDEGKALLAELGVEGDYEGNAIVILGYGEGEVPVPKPRKEGYIIKA